MKFLKQDSFLSKYKVKNNKNVNNRSDRANLSLIFNKIFKNKFSFKGELTTFLTYNKHTTIKIKQNNILLSSFIPFFIKNGNTLKNSILFFNVFTNFYKTIFNDKLKMQLEQYKYYKEFFYNFSFYNNYRNTSYLLS